MEKQRIINKGRMVRFPAILLFYRLFVPFPHFLDLLPYKDCLLFDLYRLICEKYTKSSRMTQDAQEGK